MILSEDFGKPMADPMRRHTFRSIRAELDLAKHRGGVTGQSGIADDLCMSDVSCVPPSFIGFLQR